MDPRSDIEAGSVHEVVSPAQAQLIENNREGQRYDQESLLALRPIDTNSQVTDDGSQKIRRQVEYYLGDENLPTDRFLLKRTKGSENIPVPISTLHDFARMRDYQPYSLVVLALRQSSFLVVEGEEGQETVRRKVALQEKQEGDDPSNPVEKKKKTKSKGKAQGKKSRGSGFEEWFCDPPITPAEYDEESDIYHPSRSFIERIEQCIQRYRARRKMDSVRRDIFDKYLALGGVDTTIKVFSGGALDAETLENYNAAEIAKIQASDVIGKSEGRNRKFFTPAEAEHWTVDFEGVVKGFLSHRGPRTFGGDNAEQIKSYCDVVRNFLNYVLSHGVCPEYTDQLLAARSICDLAEKELLMIKQARSLLPGTFNTSASTLYGGYFASAHVDSSEWTNEEQTLGMSIAEAERTFKTAIAFVATDKQYDSLIACKTLPKAVKTQRCNLEVVQIIKSDEVTQHLFAGTKDSQGVKGNIKPLGVLKVKHWNNPADPPEDLTDDEELEQSLLSAKANLGLETQNLAPSCTAPNQDEPLASSESELLTLFLEDEILSKIFLGLHFSCEVHTLNIGIHYFDTISGMYPSFYTFLPAELMQVWKEPKINNRPPPTVDDGADDFDDEGAHDDFD